MTCADSATEAKLVEQAVAIGEIIRARATLTRSGAALWETSAPFPAWQLGEKPSLRYDLYGGISGIALFLAALDVVQARSDNTELICAAVKPLFELSTSQVDAWLAQEEPGAGTGSVSVIYALARLSGLLVDERFLTLSLDFARRMRTETLSRGSSDDLMDGLAGSVMVWSRLYELTHDGCLLAPLLACGEQLVRRSTISSGLRAWRGSSGRFKSGYAHGAAGIAHALGRLFAATGVRSFGDAAAEAIACEKKLYVEQEGNWARFPEVDGRPGQEFWNSWCNGAPGIGLGRIGVLRCLEIPEAAADVERALRSAAKSGPLGHIDIPCCGTLGRVELFLEAATLRAHGGCRNAALMLTNAVIERAARKGRYGVGDEDEPLTFHKGLAGIGYQLLRAAFRDRLPSLLCWA